MAIFSCPQTWASLVHGFCSWTRWMPLAPGFLRPLGLGWNNISCFCGSPACREQIEGLLSLLNCMNQSLIINPSVSPSLPSLSLSLSLPIWFCFSGELQLHGWKVVITESQSPTTTSALMGFRAHLDLDAWRRRWCHKERGTDDLFHLRETFLHSPTPWLPTVYSPRALLYKRVAVGRWEARLGDFKSGCRADRGKAFWSQPARV